MSDTKIFKSYAAFLAREDKSVNGVSERFSKTYPDFLKMNQSNIGCWCCEGSKDCNSCNRCKECNACEYSKYCESCESCESCEFCTSCTSCERCRDCKDRKGCKDCEGMGND